MSSTESKAGALQRRLVAFAAAVVRLAETLPKTQQVSHISKQMLRSGTAVAANYGEARGAESKSDFVHKLRIVLKELNETLIWLQLLVATSKLSNEKSVSIIAENEELCRIVAASIRTAGGFDRSKNS